MVTMAMAASKLSSSNGSRSAVASTAGAAARGRWARIAADGSTASTYRSEGSYDPVPAPTFSTVRLAPSAACTLASIRGSVVRRTA
jgi:hypothetical protein